MVSVGMTKLAPIAIIAIALSGCSRSLHEASFTTATPVTDWGGVKNFSHDGGGEGTWPRARRRDSTMRNGSARDRMCS